MPRALPTLLVLLLALSAAPGASAQAPPGVFVDPDSPTGKEYAIPLDEARSIGRPDPAPAKPGPAAGTDADGGVAPSTRGSIPLFGAGIRASTRKKPKSSTAPATEREEPVAPETRSGAEPAQIYPSGGPASAGTVSFAVGGSVLLAGLLAAAAATAAARRRQPRRNAP